MKSMLRRCGLPVLLLLAVGLPDAAVAQLMNRGEPLPGITSSGQPNAAELAELADEGYVAVIDLRGEGEDRGFDEAGAVEELGMTYVSLPVSGAAGITYDNAEALDAVLSGIDGPVLIHCASGNRAGALLSLRQRLLGDTPEDALALGLDAGLTIPALQEVVEARLSER